MILGQRQYSRFLTVQSCLKVQSYSSTMQLLGIPVLLLKKSQMLKNNQFYPASYTDKGNKFVFSLIQARIVSNKLPQIL